MALHDDADASHATGTAPVYRSDPAAVKAFASIALLLVAIALVLLYFRQQPLLAPAHPDSYFGPTGTGAGLAPPVPLQERLWRMLPLVAGLLLLASVWHYLVWSSLSHQLLRGIRFVLGIWMVVGITVLLLDPPRQAPPLTNYRRPDTPTGGLARIDSGRGLLYGVQYLTAGLGLLGCSVLLTTRRRASTSEPPVRNEPDPRPSGPVTDAGFCSYCGTLVHVQEGRCLMCGGAVHA